MIAQPNCSKRRCIYLLGVSNAPEAEQVCTCLAFPEGIPDEIAYGNNLHLEPYPSDNGIQFEQEPEAK